MGKATPKPRKARRRCAAPGCQRAPYGPRAKWCEEHADPRNVRAKVRTQTRQLNGAMPPLPDGPGASALEPAMLAAALQLRPDDIGAAASIAGIEARDGELEALEKTAREGYASLVQGNASAIQSAGFAALSLYVLRSIAGLPRVPANQRASAAKSLVDVLERLQTAARPSFGDMSITLVEDPELG